MAEINVNPSTLNVTFSIREKVGGLLRDITIPLEAIATVTVEADGLRAAEGIRAPGLALPRWRKIGTWRHRVAGRLTRAAVCVRRGEPALRLQLHGTKWDQLLIGHTDAHQLAARLGAR